MILVLYKNFKYLGGRAGKSAMADATKTSARHMGHMTYTQAPAVHEKNLFPLISFHSASEKLLFSHTAGSHVKPAAATSQSIE